jgi:eukaryotic-like serine/threonine-protein kinase
LRLNEAAPIRYVSFLEYCTDCVFLRRAGGGYVFMHGLLQQYFASSLQEEIDHPQETVGS